MTAVTSQDQPYSDDTPQPMRSLADIRVDIMALEQAAEGLLGKIWEDLKMQLGELFDVSIWKRSG